MKKANTRRAYGRSLLLICSILIGAIVGFTFLAAAKSSTNAINITVRNDSHREIRHLYLAAGDPNNWGPDQLNGSTISPGASYTLSDVSCNGSTIRVIAEDQNGCFVYNNVSCNANQSWDITDAATPDCGS